MLESLADGWFCFAAGQRWRTLPPGYLCEVQEAGHCPSALNEPGIASRLRRIRAFYAGRITCGRLDQSGTALDILVANAMTESFGTVPSPFDYAELERRLDGYGDFPLDQRLDHLLRDLGADRSGRWLVRREPGYTTPLATPARVSVGAHHMLVETAVDLATKGAPRIDRASEARRQILLLASKSLHAAQMATDYLNGKAGRHYGHLPLIAATYNAGSPRICTVNPWHLVQYGNHVDRWISYYNASRQLTAAAALPERQEVSAPLPQAAVPPLTENAAGPLSAHFTVAELTASETATRLGLDNRPAPQVVANLRQLAELLEQIRSLLGARPLHITSGYRSPAVNRAVGSQPTSRHQFGLAADFTCSAFGSPLQICRAVAASAIPFDQIIHEYGRWVHIGLSLPGQAMRRQQLTIDRAGTHVGLLPIIG